MQLNTENCKPKNMSTFESTVTINKPVNIVYQFLADMNNHQQLMPDDDI